MIIVFVFSLFMACQITTPPSKAPSNETPVSMASVVAPITDSILPSLSKAPVPSELMEQVRSNPLENNKKIAKMSERQHDDIVNSLIMQRLAFYSSASRPSAWVLERIKEVDNENTLDYDHPFWNAIEWGIAHQKKDESHYDYPYFGYTDSDGKLHMELAYWPHERRHGLLEVEVTDESTHLWLEKVPDWKSEFCIQVEDTDNLLCNMAGAFDKYFMPLATHSFPELDFNRVGVFPR